MPVAGAFGILIARLFGFAWTKIAPAASVATRAAQGAGRAFGGRGGLFLTAGAVAADLLNIDELRQEAVRLAPTSDPEALEEAARQLLRMVGSDGTNVVWPRNGSPRYFVMDMLTGRQWFIARYINFAWVRNANRRGFSRGIRAGQRQIATISQAQQG